MQFNRHPLLFLALLAFCFTRGITPTGHMPGPVGDASPFVLCPTDTGSAAWLALIHGAHQHHHGHGQQHATDSDCPLSGLGSPASLELTAARLAPPVQGPIPAFAPTPAVNPGTRHQRPHTRAPPHTA